MFNSNSKPILTIEDILAKYYYKEWIQDELREIGENSNGNKYDLILRYVNSKKIQHYEVGYVARNLLSSLRKQELRQILHEYNIRNGKTANEMLKTVLESFTFEPFVRGVKRYCKICKVDTEQEVHYNNSWKADDFICTICRNEEKTSQNISDNKIREYKISNLQYSDTIIYVRYHSWQLLTLFLAIFFGLYVKFGWIVGITVSIIATLVAIFIGLKTKKDKRSTI